MSLEEAERLLITKALARFEGNANRAAEALGLSRSALYRRLQKYGLSQLCAVHCFCLASHGLSLS